MPLPLNAQRSAARRENEAAQATPETNRRLNPPYNKRGSLEKELQRLHELIPEVTDPIQRQVLERRAREVGAILHPSYH
ncbi:MAG: hypothetical protein ACR2PK_18890 [Acidimicrobiales bacterium]